MQRLRFAATMVALFVLTFSAGAAFAGPTADEETLPLPIFQPAVDPMAFATALAAAPIGEVLMTMPPGGYDDHPDGLKRVTLAISFAYTAPDGQVTHRTLIEKAELLRLGLVFQISGKANGKDVVLNFVYHHREERAKVLRVQGEAPQQQMVPYLCAWGPVESHVSDLTERCIRIVPPVEPAPIPTPAPDPALPASATPAPAPVRPSGLLDSDEPTPPPPSAALTTARRYGVLVQTLMTRSVGETMSLPDWVTAGPAEAPEGWGRYLVKPDTYKTGQVVALITRHGGQSTFVRAVVVGTGTGSVDVDGQVKDVKVAYVWAPIAPVVAEGDKLFIGNAVPPGCLGPAEPQHDHN